MMVDFDPFCLFLFFKVESAAKNAIGSWILNLRVCMLLKGTKKFNKQRRSRKFTICPFILLYNNGAASKAVCTHCGPLRLDCIIARFIVSEQ